MNSRVVRLSRLSCFWVVAFLAVCVTTNSPGLTIVWTEFSVSGGWSENWTDRETRISDDSSGSFDSQSVNGSWVSTHGWARGDITLGSWALRMNGDVRSGSDLSEFLTVDYVDLGMVGSATTRFHPAGTTVKLNLDAYDMSAYVGESMMQITLVDLTTSETLLDTDYWRDHPNWIADYDDQPPYEYDVDPSHLYEFRLMGAFGIWAGSYDYGDLRAEAEIVDIQSGSRHDVPDPAPGLVLLAFSLGSLCLVRRTLFHRSPLNAPSTPRLSRPTSHRAGGGLWH